MSGSGGPWIFAYGSVIWRPSFPFASRHEAIVRGFSRRFWQGSEDHRGVPGAPGRVVTLVAEPAAICLGVAYRLAPADADEVLAHLDVREQGGYGRATVAIEVRDHGVDSAITYVAPPGNALDLGDAPHEEIALQIADAVGPSGTNRDYLFELARAVSELSHPALDADAIRRHDAHLFALDARVRALTTP